MKLAIGSGKYGRQGWTTLDADPNSGAEIISTVPPLPHEVTSVKWQEIEMIHSLEHLYPWDAAQLLTEIRGVLVAGGRLTIELPDLAFAAAVLIGQKERIPGTVSGQCDMWPIYGDPNHRNPLYGHRWGYTPQTLRQALEAAGFDPEGISHLPAQHHVPVRDFRMEAIA